MLDSDQNPLTLKAVLQHIPLIYKATSALGFTDPVLCWIRPHRFNLGVHSASSDNIFLRLAELETYLAYHLKCATYTCMVNSSIATLPLDATVQEIYDFFGEYPDLIQFKASDFNHFMRQIDYEAAAAKIDTFANSTVNTSISH